MRVPRASDPLAPEEEGREMAKEGKRANGDADVYPRRNRRGEIIGYLGPYRVQTDKGPKRLTVADTEPRRDRRGFS